MNNIVIGVIIGLGVAAILWLKKISKDIEEIKNKSK